MKNNREKVVIKTSIINIVFNVILAIFKALVGFLAHSIAIISDAVNNLSDASSSIITMLGTKLAGKAPDKKHPYGYGRLEYMTTLIVSVIVLYAGLTALIESIKKIIYPEQADYNIVTILVLLAGIFIKLFLGLNSKMKGKEVNSTSLVASGSDALSDAMLSTSVLASAIIYILFDISIEAYVSTLLSLVILRSGLKLVRESVDNMLGVRIESDLARKIKKEIVKSEPAVQGVFDLVLNNYGPDKYLGSVHIEVADTLSISEVDKISRRITKTISEKYGVVLHTIGIYSINTKDEKVKEIEKNIHQILFSHPGVIQMHGFYLDEIEKSISLDMIIDFNVKDREILYRKIYDEIKKEYSDYKIIIALDADISD